MLVDSTRTKQTVLPFVSFTKSHEVAASAHHGAVAFGITVKLLAIFSESTLVPKTDRSFANASADEMLNNSSPLVSQASFALLWLFSNGLMGMNTCEVALTVSPVRAQRLPGAHDGV